MGKGSERIIVITGASSGIGEQAALQLADTRTRLCLVARRAEELQRVREAVIARGGFASIHPADLSVPEEVDRCAAAILAEQGRVDVLVNNAARSICRSVRKSLDRDHDFQRTMQLNYFAPVRLSLRLLPGMLERRHGQIVNVSSIAVQSASPGYAAYVASKSALEGFSRVLAAEQADSGIAVTLIRFPLVRTPMSLATDRYRNAHLMSPERAAGWIVEAIARRPAQIGTFVGQGMELANAIAPGLAGRWTGRAFRLAGRLMKQPAEKPER